MRDPVSGGPFARIIFGSQPEIAVRALKVMFTIDLLLLSIFCPSVDINVWEL